MSLPNVSTEIQNILAKLRPPFARSALLLYPYALEGKVNPGITVDLPAGEKAVAPGDGTVSKVWASNVTFYSENVVLQTGGVVSISLDHGHGVFTTLSGFTSSSVQIGQPIQRGDYLGPTKTSQLFLSVLIASKPVDPLAVSAHFALQNGNLVLGQTGRIRFGPDMLPRDTTEGVAATLVGGKRIFTEDEPPFLVNIDFNGTASVTPKLGPSLVGVLPDDYWNVYAPQAFTSSQVLCTHGYAYGSIYSSQPWIPLLGYDGKPSVVMLQRVPPLSSAAGTTAATFDPIASSYVGGAGVSNTFNLRNVPPGNYNLYVYSYHGSGTTDVYAASNGGTPALQVVANQPIVSWVGGQDYVVFTLTVDVSGKISLAVYGYLSALQLIRVPAA